MHMADALLSPTVGLGMWVASGVTLGWSSRRAQRDERSHLVALMGVLGAFVFAAMMINFTIPGTGSSGHLGGGLLLAILLGPPAALIVMASVLTVQALLFADGGILALGANLFNLGVCTCLLAYPLIYRPLLVRLGPNPSDRQLTVVIILTAVLGLQLGALGVVLQTWASGISSLPLRTFLWLMLPIHLAIGLVEGVATAALVLFVRRARPDLLPDLSQAKDGSGGVAASFPKGVVVLLSAGALITAGVLSWFASQNPDGLEWSIEKTSGQLELAVGTSRLHELARKVQELTSVFPDYAPAATQAPAPESAQPAALVWPAVDGGTSTAGIVGSVVTLSLVSLIGWGLHWRRQRRRQP